MIKVRISDSMMFAPDGIGVLITRETGEGLYVRRLGDGDEWEHVTSRTAGTAPTMTLSSDEARALLDALLRYYQGASDMHTVRSDLLHERGRVDKLLAAMTELAARPQTIQLRAAEQ